MLPRQTKIEINVLLTNDYEYVLFKSDVSQSKAMFVIDLTSGVATGLFCARQLASQLKFEIPERIMTGGSAETMTPINFIASWVDSEGRGDIVIKELYQLASQIATEFVNIANAKLLILLGRTDLKVLPNEELLFLWFLLNHVEIQRQTFIQAIDKVQLKAIFSWLSPCWIEIQNIEEHVTESNYTLEDLLITLLPGLIPGKLLDRLLKAGYGFSIQFLALEGGDYLLNPVQRSLAKPGIIKALSAFNLILRAFPKHYAALILRGYTPEHQDVSMLSSMAWVIAGQGGIGLAQMVLEALLSHCQKHNLTEYFEVLMELQKLRISAQNFVSAAQDIADYDLIPSHGIRDYKISLGWGRVLSGDAPGAYQVFSSIDVPTMNNIESPIDLYLCNIYALVLLRVNKPNEAMAIELAINRHLTKLVEPNYHLNYINNFNLSRLYRLQGNINLEQAYFNGVLETTDGLRTESDQIYFNLTQAAIFERQGQAVNALIATWRACVHWLACEVPEAIGWRTLLAIYSKRQAIQPALLPDISNKLAKMLSEKVHAAGLIVPEIGFQPASFIKASAYAHSSNINQAKIYSNRQYATLFGLRQSIQSSLHGVNHNDLSALVTAIYQMGTQAPLAEISTWVVDDCYGHEILDGKDGRLIASIRWGISDEQTCFFSSLKKVSVKFGQGIASADLKDNALVKVTFKRYMPPYDIPEKMQTALAKLYQQGLCTLAEFVTELNLTYENEIRQTLNQLECARVCRLVVSE